MFVVQTSRLYKKDNKFQSSCGALLGFPCCDLFGKLFDESFPWVKSWQKHGEHIQFSGLYVSCFGLATGTAICK